MLKTFRFFYRATQRCPLFDRAGAYRHRPHLHSWRRPGHCHTDSEERFYAALFLGFGAALLP